jgi:hypothetical protein
VASLIKASLDVLDGHCEGDTKEALAGLAILSGLAGLAVPTRPALLHLLLSSSAPPPLEQIWLM